MNSGSQTVPHDDHWRQQYEALTQRAGWCSLSDWTQLQFSGKDRSAFLHGMCTAEVKTRSPGESCEAFFTNVQGRVLGYLQLFFSDDVIDASGSPGQADSLIPHLDRYIIREDVTIENMLPRRRLFWLSGATAPAVLAKATGQSVDIDANQHRHLSIADASVAVRCLHVDPPVFQLACDMEHASQVTQQLTAAGAMPCGDDALETLRLELAWPYYGRDITDQNFPQEVDRNVQAISFIKGCYLGQETVARIDALGHVNWYFRRLRLPDGATWDKVPQLVDGGKTIVRITSRGYSPRWQSRIALGYVRRGLEKPGTRVPGPDGEAEVVANDE